MKRPLLVVSALLLLLVVVPGLVAVWETRAENPAEPAPRGLLRTLLAPPARALGWASDRLADTIDWVVNLRAARRRADLLDKRVARLEAENAFLREAVLKYERLQGSATLEELKRWQLVSADIVSRGGRNWARGLVVNRGRRDGVEPGDPVFHGRGLAGTVVGAGPWTASIQLLNDPQAAIGVVVLPGRHPGVVRGRGDAKALELLLENPNVPLEPGQRVISSGMHGSLFPRGLPVGEVRSIGRNRFGQNVGEVEPYVRFGRLQEVLVLTGATRDRAPAEAPETENAEDEPREEEAGP